MVVVVVGSRDYNIRRDHRLKPSPSTWTGLDFGLGLDNKVGSLITKDVGHAYLPALVGDRLLLTFVISDPTLLLQMKHQY